MKSRKRRIQDAATPTVAIAGNYYTPRFSIAVQSCGKNNTVTFELDSWQVRDLLTAIRSIAGMIKERHLEEARLVEKHVQ